MLAPVPGAAQHFFSDALQTRDRSGLGAWNDPGSAAQPAAARRLRLVREKVSRRVEAAHQ
jgi:hypothetical protein